MFLFLVLGLTPLVAADPIPVPGSTSPDGRTALFYFHDPDKALNDGYELLFGNAKSFLPSSSNLMPDMPQDLTTPKAMYEEDVSTLLGGIASGLEAGRQHVLWGAFAYRIAWSPNSQWVSIEGGAHKFWKVLAYHHHHGDYQSVALPDEMFQKYFDEYPRPRNVPDRGALMAIQRISTRDEINAYWLANGELAINAFPYLLRDPRYQEMGNLFFVVRFQEASAAITGYCR